MAAPELITPHAVSSWSGRTERENHPEHFRMKFEVEGHCSFSVILSAGVSPRSNGLCAWYRLAGCMWTHP